MKTWVQLLACAALALPATAVRADKTTDRKFVEKAASGGMAEVKLGHLAMEKGTSPAVKEFGKRMVDDHGKANDELKEIATKQNLALPTEIDSATKATYDKLTKLSGADFDKAYIDAMVKDHDKDVKEFKKETSTGGLDPELKAWAEKTLDVIEQHDHIAHQDKDAIKK